MLPTTAARAGLIREYQAAAQGHDQPINGNESGESPIVVTDSMEQAPTVGRILHQPSQNPPLADINGDPHADSNGGIIAAISDLNEIEQLPVIVTEQAPTVGQIFRQPSQQPPFTDSNDHAGNDGILAAISNLTTVVVSFQSDLCRISDRVDNITTSIRSV